MHIHLWRYYVEKKCAEVLTDGQKYTKKMLGIDVKLYFSCFPGIRLTYQANKTVLGIFFNISIPNKTDKFINSAFPILSEAEVTK